MLQIQHLVFTYRTNRYTGMPRPGKMAGGDNNPI